MGQYLAQSRIRQLDDVASGLFLCSLMLQVRFCFHLVIGAKLMIPNELFQYESFSKRVVPEAINFLASTLVLLAPAQCDFAALPGLFPTSDVASEQNKHLRLRPKAAADTIEARRADLVQLLKSSTPSEQTKVDLLSVALKLVAAFADLYIGLDAFLEIFDPLLAIMKKIAKANLPSTLSVSRQGFFLLSVETLPTCFPFTFSGHRGLRNGSGVQFPQIFRQRPSSIANAGSQGCRYPDLHAQVRVQL
jgi:nucleolar protein 14